MTIVMSNLVSVLVDLRQYKEAARLAEKAAHDGGAMVWARSSLCRAHAA